MHRHRHAHTPSSPLNSAPALTFSGLPPSHHPNSRTSLAPYFQLSVKDAPGNPFPRGRPPADLPLQSACLSFCLSASPVSHLGRLPFCRDRPTSGLKALGPAGLDHEGMWYPLGPALFLPLSSLLIQRLPTCWFHLQTAAPSPGLLGDPLPQLACLVTSALIAPWLCDTTFSWLFFCPYLQLLLFCFLSFFPSYSLPGVGWGHLISVLKTLR